MSERCERTFLIACIFAGAGMLAHLLVGCSVTRQGLEAKRPKLLDRC